MRAVAGTCKIARMDDQIERRGQELHRRAERLRISAKELSELARVSRQSTSNALAGRSVQPVTMERLEATLDRLEAEIHGERDLDAEDRVTTIVLPDGTRVTHKGGSSAEAAEFAARFLENRRHVSGESGRQ